MTDEWNQLVAEVSELTGAARPAWLAEDAPLLEATPAQAEPFYLVGLIGGKDVGKSALVNALVGRSITASASHGRGTQEAVAYVYASREKSVREFLQRIIPNQFRIVTHDRPDLDRQVLLDLPDIDSIYADHIALTRRILRHLLFPVWIGSVEKYADLAPQELLMKVAAGNAPENFIFCLNKVDQVAAAAVGELQADNARRLKRALSLKEPPRVWAISAVQSEGYELPGLRKMLSRQKSQADVQASLEQAAQRRRKSMLQWLDAQDLPGRASRLHRLLDDAQETVDDRLGSALLEKLLPRLLDDPAYRLAVLDECMARRVAAWPLVGWLHKVFYAIGMLFGRNLQRRTQGLEVETGPSLVDAHLRDLPDGQPLESLLQTTFARLQQTHPAVSELFGQCKLWEAMPAGQAAAALRNALGQAIDRQRKSAGEKLAPRHTLLMFLWRSLLTVGALAWFLFFQPLLLLLCEPHAAGGGGIFYRLAKTFTPTEFINAAVFLIVYLTVLWLLLRWDTQRRLHGYFASWRRPEGDASLNLTACTLQWLGGLVDPIRDELSRYEAAIGRIEALRTSC